METRTNSRKNCGFDAEKRKIDTPNETTRAAIEEAKEGKNLEDFDYEAFKSYVASL